MKIKKIIYYISILISFYISYLICRPFEFKVYGKIAIYIINMFFSVCITFNFIKNVSYNKIDKKSIKYSIILSCIISLILVFSIGFFTKGYRSSKIELSSDVPINSEVIESIIYNNLDNCVKNGISYDGLGRINDRIKIQQVNKNVISIEFEKNIKTTVKLRNHDYNIYIKSGNDKEKVDESFIYVKSNLEKDNLFILRTCLSICILIYILFMLNIYIINCKEKRAPIITMIIIGIIGLIYLIYFKLGNVFNDSYGYINYNFTNFIHGEFYGRTPIYPLVIRICSKLFGDSYILLTVCLFQYIVWFISNYYMYKLLNLLTGNKKISILFSILYAICPGIIGWNNNILTESLALSLTIVFIYYIVKYIKTNQIFNIAISVITASILTFIRPTSLIYIIFLEIFFIARFIFERKNIKIDFKGFLISIFAVILVIVYAAIFHNTFGIYSISDAVVRQDLYVCIEQGYYKDSNNEKFIEDVEEGKNKFPTNAWLGMSDVLGKYSLNDMQKITNYCRKKNINKYIEYINKLTKTHNCVNFDSYNLEIISSKIEIQETIVKTFDFITFFHIYVILVINTILIIYRWVKYKKVPWIYIGLFGFPFVIVFSSFIGTCGEWMRTAQCALPFAYISIAVYCKLLTNGKEGRDILDD